VSGLDILVVLMAVALCGVMLIGFPVAFTLAGTALLFAGLGILVDPSTASFLAAIPQRIYGTMTNEVLVAIPLFLLMGVLLERSRVAETLIVTLGQVLRRLPGGLAVGVSLVGALLAASTGVVGATVVMLGLLALPPMLRAGYAPWFATGSIAAAGTLGQIIPPSIVLVVLGDQLSVAQQRAEFAKGNFAPDSISVGDLFAGAMIPGLVLVGLYILFQVGIAWWRPHVAPPQPPPEEAMSLRRLAAALLAPIVLVVAVLGSILGGLATPTEAASVGAIGGLMLAGRAVGGARRAVDAAALAAAALLVLNGVTDLRLGRADQGLLAQAWIGLAGLLLAVLAWGVLQAALAMARAKLLGPSLRTTAELTAMIFTIVIGSSLFSLVFIALGGEELVRGALSSLPGGTTTAIAVVMLAVFILGFPLDFIEISYIVVPIVAPILLMMDVDPIWLGVMLAMNLQTSFLTPPLGPSLFYLQGIAPPEVRAADIYRGAWPFIGIQLVGLGVLWLFPGLATWLPRLLYGSG
jgi:tripartite ATP-independent transporter DctM subunit